MQTVYLLGLYFREKDEELGSIVLSAQILLSRLKGISGLSKRKPLEVHDFQRASMLALFVSDCFGGRDRSFSILRMRMGIVGSNKQEPFICTCSAMNIYENKESNQTCGSIQNYSFADLCENSLRIIKETRNSSVVPLGSLRFGVCRHRAVLMKVVFLGTFIYFFRYYHTNDFKMLFFSICVIGWILLFHVNL